MRIRIQGFHDQKLEKNITAETKLIFFDQKFQFTYPLAIKDVQATGEAFSPQIEYPSLHNIKFFHFFVSHFFPSGSGSAFPMRFWSGILPAKSNADPDPKHCTYHIFFHSSHNSSIFLDLLVFLSKPGPLLLMFSIPVLVCISCFMSAVCLLENNAARPPCVLPDGHGDGGQHGHSDGPGRRYWDHPPQLQPGVSGISYRAIPGQQRNYYSVSLSNTLG